MAGEEIGGRGPRGRRVTQALYRVARVGAERGSALIIDPSDLEEQSLYKLLIGSVVPRPIAWTSTVSREGTRNLAPSASSPWPHASNQFLPA